MTNEKAKRFVIYVIAVALLTTCGSSVERRQEGNVVFQESTDALATDALATDDAGPADLLDLPAPLGEAFGPNETGDGSVHSLATSPDNAELFGPSDPLDRLCAASWEERPGTADYTARDMRLASIGRERSVRLDRRHDATLRGSGRWAGLDMCGRARALEPCFVKGVLESDDWGAVVFRSWAQTKDVDPVRAHLAIAAQETLLGGLDDECSQGICNGVGLLQIVTALDALARPLASDSPSWRAITHNILSNVAFSARVLADKIGFAPSDLRGMAWHYNGNPKKRSTYASRVVASYEELERCDLWEPLP
jgi:hypothetical protein